MMNIIFQENLVPELRERYIILELDTVMQPQLEKPVTLYSLIDNVDFSNFQNLPTLIDQHQEMIVAYKNSQWDKAQFLANSLLGSWNGELDEFYNLVLETASQMSKTNTVWDGVRHTNPQE